jgi:ABC-2 type transport system ATP-binding protein
MSEPVIRTEGLTKFYGEFEAVHDLNIQVAEGVLFGFIGPNGAGKTTTIRMLCGLLKPTSGRAWVGGVDVVRHPRQVKRLVGYMPELFGTYDRMRVWEYLDFFGAAYRIGRARRRERIEHALDLAGAAYMRDYFVGSLSKGMRQRVGIAKTLVHDPAVLFLDEPTSGLDPVARIEIRELLRKLKALGKTVLISSHILPELAAVCDEVGIIEKSRLLAAGPIRKILDEISQARRVQVEVLSRPDEAAQVLARVKGVSNVQVVQNLIQFEFAGDNHLAASVVALLNQHRFHVCWMREAEADLEEVFIRVTGRATRPAEGSAT